MENDITHTLLSFLKKGTGNVLMVTSCQPGDGATYCSKKAANSLQKNTNISKILIVNASTDKLTSGAISSFDKCQFTIKKDKNNGFDTLDTKNLTNSMEKNLDDLAKALNEIKKKYQLVILDCAAITHNRMLFSLLQVTDAVMLVIAAGITRRPIIQNTIEAIQLHDGNVIGTLLNKRRFYIPRKIYRWFF